jgi:hypothetical protein
VNRNEKLCPHEKIPPCIRPLQGIRGEKGATERLFSGCQEDRQAQETRRGNYSRGAEMSQTGWGMPELGGGSDKYQ